jgi:hypothetical protein
MTLVDSRDWWSLLVAQSRTCTQSTRACQHNLGLVRARCRPAARLESLSAGMMKDALIWYDTFLGYARLRHLIIRLSEDFVTLCVRGGASFRMR